MIKFRQKKFTECDAMNALYAELKNDGGGYGKLKYGIGVIDRNSLIPILKGNNVVIERFVISTSLFGRDKFRMYLKVGAKAKMPDEVRLTSEYRQERLGGISLNFGGGDNKKKDKKKDNNQNKNQQRRKYSLLIDESGTRQKLFFGVNGNIQNLSIEYEVQKLLGEAIKYDKKERSVVLEFERIEDAIRALRILPFGFDYKIWLLNSI